jgi:hypothetical protein
LAPLAGPRRLTLGLAVAVLSERHAGQHPIERLDLEALAGEVLLIKDPGHFAIGSSLLDVVATAVVGDLEDFEGEVFRLTRARESVRAAKFLIAGEPAEHRGFGRHPGVGADRPKAFTVDEAVADRIGDLVTVRGWAAALGLVLVLHGSRLPVAALAQQRDLVLVSIFIRARAASFPPWGS